MSNDVLQEVAMEIRGLLRQAITPQPNPSNPEGEPNEPELSVRLEVGDAIADADELVAMLSRKRGAYPRAQRALCGQITRTANKYQLTKVEALVASLTARL